MLRQTRHDVGEALPLGQSSRHPVIVDAALRDQQTSFVVDGEAVLLGVDRVSDCFEIFNCCKDTWREEHSRKPDRNMGLLAILLNVNP